MFVKFIKYGIKVWLVVDFDNVYVVNFFVYFGSEGNEGRINYWYYGLFFGLEYFRMWNSLG